ncbi:hypothetical protein AVDCRST_MAG84-2981 [uncultured Microcoleus sp.]|uniref:Uncharacterized protein n=1 Tax=uncultured Microcoleus sp. TaxID=259945 RepID=A0A6J4M954_9CYAN|nr:hypothetical protein AVDCRST_MAG84-2981 [uncultured Microcoleus sp.]
MNAKRKFPKFRFDLNSAVKFFMKWQSSQIYCKLFASI